MGSGGATFTVEGPSHGRGVGYVNPMNSDDFFLNLNKISETLQS